MKEFTVTAKVLLCLTYAWIFFNCGSEKQKLKSTWIILRIKIKFWAKAESTYWNSWTIEQNWN
jgi:hypothetical protein